VRFTRNVLRLTALVGAVTGCARPPIAPAPPSACPEHTTPIAGACLSEADAHAYCGNAARPASGGCSPSACAGVEPIDLGTGECVTMRTLRKLAATLKVDVKNDATLGCAKSDARLSVDGTSVACLARATRCGRGGAWAEGACHADPACPRGSVPDAAGACVAVVHRDHGEAVLDVGTWVRLVIGPDGGKGTSTICGPLAERPWLAGIVPHAHGVVDVVTSIVFPDNDVGGARVTVNATRQQDPHMADTFAPIALTKELDPVWKTLRGLGGVANAASASAVVHCTVDGGTEAVAIPRGDKEGPPPVDSEKPAS